ncbi:V-type H+-transporting ATPase subunit C [Pseudohyphozyma bogoriensis]|nr:V-type H+-transporting ATPase subunit C [Pseudohyphozyma bogoriensis]
MSSSSSPLWLISVPSETASPQDQLEDLQPVFDGKTTKAPAFGGAHNKLGEGKVVEFPEFKTGTLSSLLTLSDVLAKSDPIVTSTLTKTVDQLKSLTSTTNRTSPLSQHLLMSDGTPYEEYFFGGWKWDVGKWRVESRNLSDVVDALTKEAGMVENAQRVKGQEYQLVKGQLATALRKKTGNLSTRSLAEVVSSEDFKATSDSEYLDTVIIAVPVNLVKEFEGSYEKLAGMVVPRSATKLASDDEFILYSVVVFKKVKDEFSQKCREAKFIVRDFTYNEEEIEKSKVELIKLEESEKELWTELLRLSRINFAELYAILVHLKVVRAYVESVLRYGLPAKYFAMIVKPDPKQQQRLLDAFNGAFASLAKSSSKMQKGKASGGSEEAPMGEFATVLEGEYESFVRLVLEPVA